RTRGPTEFNSKIFDKCPHDPTEILFSPFLVYNTHESKD
ncbi:MAG: hypothetical protein US64_C0004G0108, partial [Candidatus Nomurabacteria bacterium GW2011_GWC1_37_9]